ncbi:MAG: hypothetical protein ACRBEE_05885 [Arenicella sp.]
MPNVGTPQYSCDNDFDLDAISIEKNSSQLQVDSAVGLALPITQVVEGDFTRTATKFFSYDESTESFIALQTTKFALLGFYIGTGWSGGSTGSSSVMVGVNDTPIATSTTVNQADVNILFSVQLNFPVGQEEAGALKEMDITVGQHLQLFTQRQGNQGGSNESGSDAPDLLEYAQIIFIERE